MAARSGYLAIFICYLPSMALFTADSFIVADVVPSPNFDARKHGLPPDMVLLHYTGMQSGDAALNRLTSGDSKVSAHYVVFEDGRIVQCVPEHLRAWHAGVSCWAGERDINARSIGIELVNPGHEFGYVPFPEEQMAALIDLAGDILKRHPIPPHRVLGHSDVAPARKTDPGEFFSWAQLADFGIGLWPQDGGAALAQPVESALAGFGYGVEGVPLDVVVAAFQRHFRPARVDGIADRSTIETLRRLIDALPAAD
jgi:N-acetylmuramoyl-L-alanine amidase